MFVASSERARDSVRDNMLCRFPRTAQRLRLSLSGASASGAVWNFLASRTGAWRWVVVLIFGEVSRRSSCDLARVAEWHTRRT